MRINKFRQINQNLSRGEVFTPPQLVIKILSKIPESVYLNKESMFLVPGCGMGVFMVELVRILVEKYGYSIEDAKSRVIGIDNRIKYINYLKRKGYRVYHLDFLKDELPMMQFDVIVGNPPYQENLVNSNKKAEKLWPKFIFKSEQLLNKNGILMFITPTSWLSGSKNIIKGSLGVMDLFLRNNLKYIETGFSFKGVSVDTHFWMMQKNQNYTNTDIFDSQTNKLKSISIHSGFLPSDLDFDRISIIEKVFSVKSFDWISSTSMYSKWRKDSVNEQTPTHQIKTYVRGGNDEDVNFAYFKQECSPKNNKIKKVIIPLSGAEKFKPYIDIQGIPYCVDSYLIPLDENSTYESVYSIFYSKLYKYLIESYRTSGFIQYPIVKQLPKFDTKKVYTDTEIYNYLGLSKSEIDKIENYVG